MDAEELSLKAHSLLRRAGLAELSRPVLVGTLIIALALALILSTFYVFYRDVLHIWEVLQQIIFYAMPIIYPLSFITDKHPEYRTIANLELMNPIAQTIQDIRHNFIAPATQPTVWNTFGSWWVKMIPIAITVLLLWFGVYIFRKNSRRFAEVM